MKTPKPSGRRGADWRCFAHALRGGFVLLIGLLVFTPHVRAAFN